jgi:hypothetical protein
MKNHLLIFAWEYNGYHSIRGTALSKRPRQLAESFIKHGWDVTVIHKDQRGESGENPFYMSIEQSGVHRVAIRATDETEVTRSNTLVRRLETLYYVSFRGDRTYRWSDDVIKNFDQLPLQSRPTYIIGMFSPRVPLFLADHFSRKLNVPWVADIQDPIYEGVAKKMWPMLNKWTRNVLKSAHAISHISPTWAAIDAARLDRKIDTIRHAIPKPVTLPEVASTEADNIFRVFYGGSIAENIQSLDVIKQVIDRLAAAGTTLRVVLAGNENALKIFTDGIGASNLEYKGWLAQDAMYREIARCQCTLVVPWSKERIGIPSKFYELCAYPKPIWIAGHDLGAFKSLLVEWGHPAIETSDIEWQYNAIIKAAKGDFSQLFQTGACTEPMLTEDGLATAFEALITG